MKLLAPQVALSALCFACNGAPPADAANPKARDSPSSSLGHARLDDGVISLSLSRTAYRQVCVDEPRIEKAEGRRWVALRDERPPSHANPGYFLDGAYVSPSFNEGCDVRGCVEVQSPLRVGAPVEYVRSGTRDDAHGKQVAVIESRPVAQAVRVAMPLHANARCDEAIGATFEVTQ